MARTESKDYARLMGAADAAQEDLMAIFRTLPHADVDKAITAMVHLRMNAEWAGWDRGYDAGYRVATEGAKAAAEAMAD